MSILVQDVTYGVRQLRRTPLFTLTAVLTLAIGIGANTTIFTLANALLFREPAGVARPDRLVDIGVSLKGVGFGSGSYPNYGDIAQRVTTLDAVYAHPRFPHAMTLDGNERVFATEVTTNYFTVLGVLPAAGRLFGPIEDAPDAPPAAVLNHRFWIRRFQGDPSIIGRSVQLNGERFVVVGVAADRFQGTGIRAPDLWLVLRKNANRAASMLVMGGRLKVGATL